jgi:hypothetical protein
MGWLLVAVTIALAGYGYPSAEVKTEVLRID